jgi:hypothetical protein
LSVTAPLAGKTAAHFALAWSPKGVTNGPFLFNITFTRNFHRLTLLVIGSWLQTEDFFLS